MLSNCRMMIKAVAVTDCGNGYWDVEIVCSELTPAEQTLFNRLFPNTAEAAFTLLNREAMLASILTSPDRQAVINVNESRNTKRVAK